jgi:hypothetical protein
MWLKTKKHPDFYYVKKGKPFIGKFPILLGILLRPRFYYLRTTQHLYIEKASNYRSLSAILAVWTGLEPATFAVTGRHSNQLNYQTVA